MRIGTKYDAFNFLLRIHGTNDIYRQLYLVCLFVSKAKIAERKKNQVLSLLPQSFYSVLLRNPIVRGNIHRRTLKNIACQRAFIGCEPRFCIYCIYLSSTKGIPISAIVVICVTVAVVVVAIVIWWRFVDKKTTKEDVALSDSGLYQ